MDALKEAEPDLVGQFAEQVELDPKELELLLAVAFQQGSNVVLRYLKREGVTEAEADRWAKCTRIVYGHYMKSADAGMIVHAALTVGILGAKPKLKEVDHGQA